MSTLLAERKMNKNEVEKWYDDNKEIHKDFCNKIQGLLKDFIDSEGIQVADITGRVKEKKSMLEKFDKKSYENVEQLTDVVGVRVISYALEDIEKICSLVKGQFDIVEKDSGDKSKELGVNKVGYQSVHYVAELKSQRCEWLDFKRFKDMKFEIQIRTLLQHAWAAIAHDNCYKFSGVLPEGIERNFYLVSGTLELMDNEFQRLVDELNTYEQKTKKQIESDKLDIEINSTSLYEYLSNKFTEHDNVEKTFRGIDNVIIKELKAFGINTIRELDSYIKPKFLESYKDIKNSNYLELLRHFMIASDATTYFEKSWNKNWNVIRHSTDNWFEKHYPDVDIYHLANKYRLGFRKY